MKRLVGVLLLFVLGCAEATPVLPVATTPPKPGEPPRPFSPPNHVGEWEPKILKELRKNQPAKEPGR